MAEYRLFANLQFLSCTPALSLLFIRHAFHDRKIPKENSMAINTRRNFFGKIAAVAALVTGTPKFVAQQTPPAGAPTPAKTPLGGPGGDTPRRPGGGNHTHDG